MDGAAVDVPSREALRRRIDAELLSGWELYVALRGKRVAGMLALKPGAAILDQIFVAPAEQEQGVGRALLDVAKERIAAGFTLRMAASNEEARRFFQAGGLKKPGEGTHPRTGISAKLFRPRDGAGAGGVGSVSPATDSC